MKRILIISLMICLSICSAFADHYNFAFVENQPLQTICSLIIKTIYEELGIEIELSPMSPIRAEKEASSGTVAGEIGRIYQYGTDNPTLIRVPTPYYKIETMAFIHRDSEITEISLDSLRKYKVVRIRGIKNTNNLTRDIEGVLDFDTIEQMMEFILLGRADIAITGRINGLHSMNMLGITEIIPLEPPLIINDFYHYIHVDHSELVPLIDEMIKEMHSNGELARLTEDIEQFVLSE